MLVMTPPATVKVPCAVVPPVPGALKIRAKVPAVLPPAAAVDVKLVTPVETLALGSASVPAPDSVKPVPEAL